MIAASYIFVETRTGRPLRYPEDQLNESGTVVQSANEQGALTPDGKGAVREFESLGTGFLVGDGFVLTNRHVAQPWLADERAQSLNSTVPGQPRLKKLVAFFPDQVQPVVLKFKEAAPREDLAVCTFDSKDVTVQIPVLPLEKDSDTVAVGRTVVTMGYPLGPDRLLALLDENEARSVQARYGSLESLLGYFAQTKHIQPQTTQGSITDLNARSIVYDARTAEGGSGAPLFGPSGRVIGISYGVLPENTASNFAVPVRYAIALLQRAGWRPPESLASEQNENSNASQTNPRSTTGSVNAH
jgi:S1-C subfamily serine protease